tara:strand:- start:358 stop:573 length:216 start_codon:yes stop_codon:yes gene_type:complete
MNSVNISFPFKIGFRDSRDAQDYVAFLNKIAPPGTKIIADEIGFDTLDSQFAPPWGPDAGPYFFVFRVGDA